jgi:glycosyltransferase involved in cell wall biosynthesis
VVRIYCTFRRSTKFTSTWHEFWSQDYWQYYLGFLRGVLGFAIQAISLKMPHKIIAVSDHTKNLILGSHLITSEKVSVVCNGIDPNLINEAKRLRKPTTNTIVTVGRLIPEKRVDLLIEVVGRLLKTNHDIHLRIIGDGPEKERLLVLGATIQAEFLGFIEDHLDVLIEVASSSVFISMSEREGFNISALEACELGVPTFARSGWFDHPNLNRMTPASMKEILQYLPKTPIPPTEVSNQFIWDRIVAQMEEALV